MLLKRLFLFAIPAYALLLSGVLMRQKQIDTIEILLLTWATFSGILIVYRYNDFACGLSSSWKPVLSFFSRWSNTILVAQFFLIGIPLSWFYLNEFQFFVLAMAGILGIAYAVKFQWGALSWFPKRKFPIKNILIGCVWAALFLVGFGQMPDSSVWSMYGFISVQVFVGSIIRDVPDTEVDLTRKTLSLPILVGAKTSLLFLHLFNLAALLFCFLLPLADQNLFYFVFMPVVFWRAVVLIFIQLNPNFLFWTQWANLYTCLLILFCLMFIIS
jgi:4-hydroxybenzoate polyprenyltransferase